jgi:hypothetical protein
MAAENVTWGEERIANACNDAIACSKSWSTAARVVTDEDGVDRQGVCRDARPPT